MRHENAYRYVDAEIVSTFIYSKLDRQVLEKLPSHKLISTRSTGYTRVRMHRRSIRSSTS